MPKYNLEFILENGQDSCETVRNALFEFGGNPQVSECEDTNGSAKSFKININTDEPEAVFDICAQFGKIKAVKIRED